MSLIEYFRRKIKGNKYDSDTYVNYLRRCGIKIGDNTRFYNVEFALVDTTRPYLIEIGDNVKLTKGITILSHDYAWSVIKNKYGNVMGSAGNVIIGAGSVVSKDIPSDCVAIGSPAKPVMTLEEYYYRRIESQEKEVEDLIKAYQVRMGKNPGEDELKDFFWLFTDINDSVPPIFENCMRLCGSEDISYQMFSNNKKKYTDMNELIEHVANDI